MPLIQFMVQVIDSFATKTGDSIEEVSTLLKSLIWPESKIFCRSAVFASFALFKAAVGVPCLLRLYTRGSTLDSVLVYLARYFSSTLASSLQLQLDEIVAFHSQGQFVTHSDRFSDLMAIFGHREIFTSVVRDWTSLQCDSSPKRDELARWLLSLRSLPFTSPEADIETLIIANLDEIGPFLTHIIAAASQIEAEHQAEPKLFESLHARFFEGLMQHMSGQSSKMMLVLHDIIQWTDAERYVPKERLNKWRHFEAVASQYAMCDDGPRLLYETTKNSVVIESAKTQVPEYRLNWEALKTVFSLGDAASQRETNDSTHHPSSIRHWSPLELENFLTNLWINMKGRENEIASHIPLEWLLALIDQAPLNIVYLAYVILEYALTVSSDVKLALFSPFLLNYFESLLRLRTPKPASSSIKNAPTSSLNQDSMDIDETMVQDATQTTDEQKLIFVKSLFRKLRSNRSICAFFITEIVSKLCVDAPGDEKSIEKWNLPKLIPESTAASSSWRSNSSNGILSHLNGIDQDKPINSPEESLEHRMEKLESNPLDILSNVRKRCRMIGSDASLGLEPATKRMASAFPEIASSSSPSNPTHGFLPRVSPQPSSLLMSMELLILAESLSFPFVPPPSSPVSALPPGSASSQMVLSSEHVSSRVKSNSTAPQGDLGFKISETLVAEVDGRYPLVSAYDVYFDVLPKKPLFERNRYLEQLFLQRPILWSILEVISATPTHLYPCRHIIMTLLTNFVGAWNAQPQGDPAKSNHLWAHTLQLLRLLDLCCNSGPIHGHNAPAPVYEPLIQGVGVALELCTASEVAQLLLGFFRFCVARLSSHSARNQLGASLQMQHWLITPLKYILRKNVHLLSEKANFLYRRIISFAAQNSVAPPSSSATPTLSQQHQGHGSAHALPVSSATINSSHPMPQNIL